MSFIILHLFFAALSLSSCKPTPLEKSESKYIIGDNDIKNLTDSHGSQVSENAINASVLIVTKNTMTETYKFCSGTLITPNGSANLVQVLTSNHCFAEPDSNGNATPRLRPSVCSHTEVYFGFSKKNEYQKIKLPCKRGSLLNDFFGDLAAFELEGSLPTNSRPLKIWAEATPANRPAYIIHYPNINSQMKVDSSIQVSLPTASITLKDCLSFGFFDKADWSTARVIPVSIRHNCDLTHGSSGSALIDLQTHQVLGVNWGGLKIKKNGNVRIENGATSAEYIRAFLNHKTDAYRANLLSSSADAISGSRRQISQPSSSNSVSKVKENPAQCGTVSSTKNSTSNKSVSHFLFLVLLLPLFLVSMQTLWVKEN